MVRLREASFDDHAGIAAVMRLNGLNTDRIREEWMRLWTENPAFTDNDRPLKFGWVLETDEGEIAGFLGSIPVFCELDGRRLTAASAHAWTVVARHRRAADNSSNSFLLMKAFFSQPEIDIYICNTSNGSTGRVFTKFDGKRVPSPDYDRPVYCVTNFPQFGQSVLRGKKLPAAGALGYAAGLGMMAASPFMKRAERFRPPGDLRVEVLTEFDARFDEFWDRIKGDGRRLLFARDRRSLEWHFHYAFSRKLGWVAVCKRGAEMAGYAVFLRNDNRHSGLKRIWTPDLQAPGEGAEDVILTLLEHGRRECARLGCGVFESVGFAKEKRDIIKRLLPWDRAYPCWPYFYKAREESLARELDDAALWDPCVMDGDASL